MVETVWLQHGESIFEVVRGSVQHKQLLSEGWTETDAPEPEPDAKAEPDGVDVEGGLRDEITALKEQVEEAKKACAEANKVAESEAKKRLKLAEELKANTASHQAEVERLVGLGHQLQTEMQALTAERDKAEAEVQSLKAALAEANKPKPETAG